MSTPIVWLVASVVALSVLSSSGPALGRLAHAAVALVIALGAVIMALRLVWYFTSRY